VVIIAVGTAVAHADAPKLEVSPSRVELCAFADNPVTLALTFTSGGAKLDGLTIEAASRTHATFTTIALPTLPASSTVVWDVALHADGSPLRPGTVFVRAFQGKSPRLIAAQTSFELAPAPVTTASVGTLTAKGPVGPINERHAGTAFVLLTSGMPYPIHAVLDLQNAKDHPPVAATLDKTEVDISPFATVVVPATLTWQGVGKSTMVVAAALTWQDGECRRSGSLSAAFDAQTESQEVAAVLAVAGIPALLLLPGFLIMAVAAILWKIGLRIGKRSGDFPFPFTTPEFWVLAVVLSFGALKLAAARGKDLLEEYRLADVIYLWIASILAGLGLYVLLLVMVRAAMWLVERARHLPLERDDAATTLFKLGQRDQPTRLPALQYEYETGKTETWMEIAKPTADATHVWIAPGIEFRSDAAVQQRAAELKQLRTDGNASRLAAWFALRNIDLSWASNIPSPGPRVVELAKLKPLGKRHILQGRDPPD
jgi:hypothetical protein